MSYLISACKRKGKFIYRVWADDEREYGPEMNEIEIMDWAKVIMVDVSDILSERMKKARAEGTSGVFDVGVGNE